MPSLSLNVGLNNGRKLPFGGGAAPSNISLTAPTIYVSGLSFADGPNRNNGSLFSPYTLVSSGYWDDINDVGFVTNSGGTWLFFVFAFDNDSNIAAALVATNTAPATSLPTTGWVNSQGDLTVSGTLVISTTP
jgi:hypothetical protein